MPTWSEIFTGPAGSPPDTAYWTSVQNGAGGGNQELEYYTPENNALDGNGNLVITADRDNGRYAAWYGPSQFTSGKLWTLGKIDFKYGTIAITASMPETAGQPGAWPAIWMLGADYPSVGWPECGEIDIMENFGVNHNAAQISSSIHTSTDNLTQDYNFPAGQDATQEHTYAVSWRPTSLTFSVDGKAFFTVYNYQLESWPYDKPFFLILNLAVGGSMGGAVPASAALPYRMVISEVAVYNSDVYQK